MDDKRQGIYIILNIVNLKVYVGSTTQWKVRRRQHINALKRGKHKTIHLQRSFNKHGKDAFTYFMVERVPSGATDQETDELLRLREKYWIDEMDSANRMYGYNLQIDPFRYVASDETNAKIRDKISEMWTDPAYRERMTAHWDDPEFRATHKELMAEIMNTPAYKQKQSEFNKQKWQNPEFQEKRKVALKIAMNKPEYKQHKRNASKRNWQNPDFRRKRKKSMDAVRESPEYREHLSAASKKKWEDPGFRERKIAACKASWQDPVIRAKRIAGIKATFARKREMKAQHST